MEKFLLRLLSAGDKLHVIDQQEIRLAVFFPHLGGLARTCLDCGDQLVGQIVALDVSDLHTGIFFTDRMCHGVDQMRFAETGIPVNKKRVIMLCRRVRHGAGGCIGKLVGIADHEGFKGKFAGIQKRSGFFLLFSAEGRKLGLREKLHLKVGGEDIAQNVFDFVHIERFYRPALKVAGTV